MRSFSEWLCLVDETTFRLGGISLRQLATDHPYHYWWATGCSPFWAARQALSMDNG